MQSEIEMVKSEPKGRIDMEKGETSTKTIKNYMSCRHLQSENAGNLGAITVCGCEGSAHLGRAIWVDGCTGCDKYERREEFKEVGIDGVANVD